jgi:F-type H+-transporting ATPase subunit a
VSLYAPLEHVLHVPEVVQAAVLALGLLALAGAIVRRRLAAADGGVLPDEGVTLRNVAEVMVESLAGLARSTMGEDWRRYFPVVGTIFVFILVSNVMGLVPGLGGSTSDVNTTAGWAVISFLVYNVVGIRTHGWRYVYQFMGPSLFELHAFGRHFHVRALTPLMLPLELLLHFARIVTLAIRLLANMFADHTVVGVFIWMVPPAIPALFMGLGLLVAVLQAFVFSLLTMIYIGQAQEEPH